MWPYMSLYPAYMSLHATVRSRCSCHFIQGTNNVSQGTCVYTLTTCSHCRLATAYMHTEACKYTEHLSCHTYKTTATLFCNTANSHLTKAILHTQHSISEYLLHNALANHGRMHTDQCILSRWPSPPQDLTRSSELT